MVGHLSASYSIRPGNVKEIIYQCYSHGQHTNCVCHVHLWYLDSVWPKRRSHGVHLWVSPSQLNHTSDSNHGADIYKIKNSRMLYPDYPNSEVIGLCLEFVKEGTGLEGPLHTWCSLIIPSAVGTKQNSRQNRLMFTQNFTRIIERWV